MSGTLEMTLTEVVAEAQRLAAAGAAKAANRSASSRSCRMRCLVGSRRPFFRPRHPARLVLRAG